MPEPLLVVLLVLVSSEVLLPLDSEALLLVSHSLLLVVPPLLVSLPLLV
jgi:hypothetical protein